MPRIAPFPRWWIPNRNPHILSRFQKQFRLPCHRNRDIELPCCPYISGMFPWPYELLSLFWDIEILNQKKKVNENRPTDVNRKNKYNKHIDKINFRFRKMHPHLRSSIEYSGRWKPSEAVDKTILLGRLPGKHHWHYLCISKAS